MVDGSGKYISNPHNSLISVTSLTTCLRAQIPPGDLFNLGTKAYHGVDRKSLEGGLSQEERDLLKRKRSIESEVRPACDRVYSTNLKLAEKLTGGIKTGAKKDGE